MFLMTYLLENDIVWPLFMCDVHSDRENSSNEEKPQHGVIHRPRLEQLRGTDEAPEDSIRRISSSKRAEELSSQSDLVQFRFVIQTVVWLTLLTASGVQIPATFPIAQRLTPD